jgi:hypothetical protein
MQNFQLATGRQRQAGCLASWRDEVVTMGRVGVGGGIAGSIWCASSSSLILPRPHKDRDRVTAIRRPQRAKHHTSLARLLVQLVNHFPSAAKPLCSRGRLSCRSSRFLFSESSSVLIKRILRGETLNLFPFPLPFPGPIVPSKRQTSVILLCTVQSHEHYGCNPTSLSAYCHTEEPCILYSRSWALLGAAREPGMAP